MNITRKKICSRAIKSLLIMLAAAMPFQVSQAVEGGVSHYMPGTYNDFFMNMQLPEGFYFRDDLMYYGAELPQPVTLGRNVVANANLDMWTSISKILYVSDVEILGGRYGAGLFLPLVFDAYADVSATGRAGRSLSTQDSQGGVGDLVAVPLSLTWKWDAFNFNLSQAVFMPSGYYNEDQLVSLGKNYWSFDTIAGLTWLHPTQGHEVSFNVGFMSNTENSATQYQSGDEFHLDYTVAQHLSKEFGIGVTGYFYHQLTADESPQLDRLQTFINRLNLVRSRLGAAPLPGVGGFEGEAAGVGPIVRYTPTLAGKQVTFIGKWIHEFDVEKRFEGEIGMVSVALEF